MKQNKLKKILAEGKSIVNGWLQIPNSFSAEVMANQEWDSLTIDMQHGVVDYMSAVQILQSISTTNIVPMARVPWNEPGQIMKILDAGCYGVICPMVSNRKEAENFINKNKKITVDVVCGKTDNPFDIKMHKLKAIENYKDFNVYQFSINIFQGIYSLTSLNSLDQNDFKPNDKFEGQLCYRIPDSKNKKFYK